MGRGEGTRAAGRERAAKPLVASAESGFPSEARLAAFALAIVAAAGLGLALGLRTGAAA